MSRFEKPRIWPKATDLGVYDLFENDSLFKNLKTIPNPPKWSKITFRASNNMILGVQGGVGLIRSAKIAQKWTSKKSSNLKKSLIKWRKVYYISYIIYFFSFHKWFFDFLEVNFWPIFELLMSPTPPKHLISYCFRLWSWFLIIWEGLTLFLDFWKMSRFEKGHIPLNPSLLAEYAVSQNDSFFWTLFWTLKMTSNQL